MTDAEKVCAYLRKQAAGQEDIAAFQEPEMARLFLQGAKEMRLMADYVKAADWAACATGKMARAEYDAALSRLAEVCGG